MVPSTTKGQCWLSQTCHLLWCHSHRAKLTVNMQAWIGVLASRFFGVLASRFSMSAYASLLFFKQFLQTRDSVATHAASRGIYLKVVLQI